MQVRCKSSSCFQQNLNSFGEVVLSHTLMTLNLPEGSVLKWHCPGCEQSDLILLALFLSRAEYICSKDRSDLRCTLSDPPPVLSLLWGAAGEPYHASIAQVTFYGALVEVGEESVGAQFFWGSTLGRASAGPSSPLLWCSFPMSGPLRGEHLCTSNSPSFSLPVITRLACVVSLCFIRSMISSFVLGLRSKCLFWHQDVRAWTSSLWTVSLLVSSLPQLHHLTICIWSLCYEWQCCECEKWV